MSSSERTQALVTSERLDPRALKRVSGHSWQRMRPLFEQVSNTILSLSPTANGKLTTIYVKFVSQETGIHPFAVLWIKKASEMVLGLALPERETSPHCALVP